jgi:hypothetical protein
MELINPYYDRSDVCVCVCGIVKINLLTIVGVQILGPEIDMKSEMSCLLFGITEVAAGKAAKCNISYDHPTPTSPKLAWHFEIT